MSALSDAIRERFPGAYEDKTDEQLEVAWLAKYPGVKKYEEMASGPGVIQRAELQNKIISNAERIAQERSDNPQNFTEMMRMGSARLREQHGALAEPALLATEFATAIGTGLAGMGENIYHGVKESPGILYRYLLGQVAEGLPTGAGIPQADILASQLSGARSASDERAEEASAAHQDFQRRMGMTLTGDSPAAGAAKTAGTVLPLAAGAVAAPEATLTGLGLGYVGKEVTEGVVAPMVAEATGEPEERVAETLGPLGEIAGFTAGLKAGEAIKPSSRAALGEVMRRYRESKSTRSKIAAAEGAPDPVVEGPDAIRTAQEGFTTSLDDQLRRSGIDPYEEATAVADSLLGQSGELGEETMLGGLFGRAIKGEGDKARLTGLPATAASAAAKAGTYGIIGLLSLKTGIPVHSVLRFIAATDAAKRAPGIVGRFLNRFRGGKSVPPEQAEALMAALEGIRSRQGVPLGANVTPVTAEGVVGTLPGGAAAVAPPETVPLTEIPGRGMTTSMGRVEAPAPPVPETPPMATTSVAPPPVVETPVAVPEMGRPMATSMGQMTAPAPPPVRAPAPATGAIPIEATPEYVAMVADAKRHLGLKATESLPEPILAGIRAEATRARAKIYEPPPGLQGAAGEALAARGGAEPPVAPEKPSGAATEGAGATPEPKDTRLGPPPKPYEGPKTKGGIAEKQGWKVVRGDKRNRWKVLDRDGNLAKSGDGSDQPVFTSKKDAQAWAYKESLNPKQASPAPSEVTVQAQSIDDIPKGIRGAMEKAWEDDGFTRAVEVGKSMGLHPDMAYTYARAIEKGIVDGITPKKAPAAPTPSEPPAAASTTPQPDVATLRKDVKAAGWKVTKDGDRWKVVDDKGKVRSTSETTELGALRRAKRSIRPKGGKAESPTTEAPTETTEGKPTVAPKAEPDKYGLLPEHTEKVTNEAGKKVVPLHEKAPDNLGELDHTTVKSGGIQSYAYKDGVLEFTDAKGKTYRYYDVTEADMGPVLAAIKKGEEGSGVAKAMRGAARGKRAIRRPDRAPRTEGTPADQVEGALRASIEGKGKGEWKITTRPDGKWIASDGKKAKAFSTREAAERFVEREQSKAARSKADEIAAEAEAEGEGKRTGKKTEKKKVTPKDETSGVEPVPDADKPKIRVAADAAGLRIRVRAGGDIVDVLQKSDQKVLKTFEGSKAEDAALRWAAEESKKRGTEKTPTTEAPPTKKGVSKKVLDEEANPISVTEGDTTFKTGQKVTFSAVRNTERAPKPGPGDQFQQNLEPSGTYMNLDPGGSKLPTGWEKGSVTFENPLVLKMNNNPNATRYYGPDSWKARLSKRYGGKTGKELTKALRKDGYDGIVTVDEKGVSEIVDLRGGWKAEEPAGLTGKAGSALRGRRAAAAGTETVPYSYKGKTYQIKRSLSGKTYSIEGVEELPWTKNQRHKSVEAAQAFIRKAVDKQKPSPLKALEPKSVTSKALNEKYPHLTIRKVKGSTEWEAVGPDGKVVAKADILTRLDSILTEKHATGVKVGELEITPKGVRPAKPGKATGQGKAGAALAETTGEAPKPSSPESLKKQAEWDAQAKAAAERAAKAGKKKTKPVKLAGNKKALRDEFGYKDSFLKDVSDDQAKRMLEAERRTKATQANTAATTAGEGHSVGDKVVMRDGSVRYVHEVDSKGRINVMGKEPLKKTSSSLMSELEISELEHKNAIRRLMGFDEKPLPERDFGRASNPNVDYTNQVTFKITGSEAKGYRGQVIEIIPPEAPTPKRGKWTRGKRSTWSPTLHRYIKTASGEQRWTRYPVKGKTRAEVEAGLRKLWEKEYESQGYKAEAGSFKEGAARTPTEAKVYAAREAALAQGQKPITKATLEQQFPWMKGRVIEDGPDLIWQGKSDQVTFRQDGSVEFLLGGKGIGHTAEMRAALKSGKAYTRGSTTVIKGRMSRDAVVKAYDEGVLDHEMYHVFEELFATDREISLIQKRLAGKAKRAGRSINEEGAAGYEKFLKDEAFRESLNKTALGRLYNRIHNFITRMIDTHTSGSMGTIYRQVKSGKPFTERSGGGLRGFEYGEVGAPGTPAKVTTFKAAAREAGITTVNPLPRNTAKATVEQTAPVTRYSAETWFGGRHGTDTMKSGRDAFIAQAKKSGMSKKAIEDGLRAADRIAHIEAMKPNVLPDYAVRDASGKPLSSVRPNRDFGKSFDLDTECIRAAPFHSLVNAIQGKLKAAGDKAPILGQGERIKLGILQRKMGDQPQCSYCYSGAGRNAQADFVARAIKEGFTLSRKKEGYAQDGKTVTMPNGKKRTFKTKKAATEFSHEPEKWGRIPASWILTPREALLPTLTPRQRAHFLAMETYLRGAGANKVKPITPYQGEFLDMTAAEIETANSRWGIRFNSNTDFKPYHALDAVQGVNDLAAKKVAAHNYTKEPDFVISFGDTGIKINMSLFGRGDGKGGIIFDAVEGMDPKFVRWAQKRYKDAGGMLLATDEGAVIAGMRPENNSLIGQIIPHHGSNQPKAFLEQMKWKNYRDAHERPLLEQELAPGAKKTDFHGYIERNLHKDNVERFLSICEKRQLRPRHAEFIYQLDKDGRIQRGSNGKPIRRWTGKVGEKNVAKLLGIELTPENLPRIRKYGKQMEQGYMKMVADYARRDTPLRPVQTKYNLKHIEKMLKDWQDEGVKAGTESAPENANMDIVNAYIELRERGELPDPRAFSGKDNLPPPKPKRITQAMKE